MNPENKLNKTTNQQELALQRVGGEGRDIF